MGKRALKGMPVRVSLPPRARAGADDGEMPKEAEASASDQGRGSPSVPPVPNAPGKTVGTPVKQMRMEARAATLARAATDEGKQQLLAALERDFTTKAGAVVNSAQENTWEVFHVAWFGSQVTVLPLTAEKLLAVASCFKDAGYKSFHNYVARAKDLHISAGYEWSLLLTRTAMKALRSVNRGAGPRRQALPINLEVVMMCEAEVTIEVKAAQDLFTFSCMFMLREIELAALKSQHVTFNDLEKTVSVYLALSKTDTEARGCIRKWGCLCASDARAPCAYHAGKSQWDRLMTIFKGDIDDDAPFFPNEAGQHRTKQQTIDAFILLARHVGAAVECQGRKISGHTARISGAQFLASIGVEVAVIMLLARWESRVVLHYIKEAPLLALTGQARIKLQKHKIGAVNPDAHAYDLEESVKTLSRKITSLHKKFQHLAALREDDLTLHEDTILAGQCVDPDLMKVIVNCETGVVHIRASKQPYSKAGRLRFTTLCGWAFSRRPHKVIASGKDSTDKCRRCRGQFVHFDSGSSA